MDNARAADALIRHLKLDRPPVALAFVAEQPASVAVVGSGTPSACTFWRRGETDVFYAPASAHYECPVGAMTMGFELPPERAGEAGRLVETMAELGYFSLAEVPHLPSVQKPHGGIVYGPLAHFPLQPDAVIVQANPRQAMLLAEADQGTTLRETPSLAAMGRPACAVVARATNEAMTTLSLGCIGARTYVELADDRVLVVLPAGQLTSAIERLPQLARANEILAGYHGEKKARFEAEP